MRVVALTVILIGTIALPAGAVEFLGIELCEGAPTTALVLPEGTGLTIESVEIGSRGDLVILLAATGGDALARVDDLMERYTGSRGTGGRASLQWSGRKITAFGKEVTKKYVALAVSTSDDCGSATGETSGAAPVEAVPDTVTDQPGLTGDGLVIPDEPAEAAMVAAAAAAAQPVAEPPVTQSDPAQPATPSTGEEPAVTGLDFVLLGRLQHGAAPQWWVDVMGVVANHTDQSFQLATFDLSFYDASGGLICVDTISVSVLKPGQERAFRDSIQCPDYQSDAVAVVKLQFAGGL